MKHQDIVEWKIAVLNGEQDSTMTPEIAQYLKSHPELEQELVFIEQFWTSDSGKLAQPSPAVSANFYKMLSQAQAAQPTPVEPVTSHWLDSLKHWLAPKPMAQFAALGLVFTLGFGTSQFSSVTAPEQGLMTLQQEVSSLSTMLAISMLQRPSASERLTGVAYSRQSDLTDPQLSQTLVDLLANDRSTPVRLAILSTLQNMNDITAIESNLLTLAINEQNALVQMELCRLLLAKASTKGQQHLLEQLGQQDLNQDVENFLQELNSLAQI